MTAPSRYAYFHVLDDIVNKYNNTVHITIKMKPIEVTDDSYAEYNEDFNKKEPKFKFGDHVRISEYKNIFAKGYAPNWSEEVFVINRIKIQFLGLMLLVTSMVKKLLEVFMKKNCKKLLKKNLEQKKQLKEKVINCMSNGKGIKIVLIVGLIKKDIIRV